MIMSTTVRQDCQHDLQLIVKKRNVNDTVHYGLQCQHCGKWTPKKKAALSMVEIEGAIEYDEEISKRYWRQQMDSLAEQREQEERQRKQEFFAKYSVYLRSEKWRNKRARVLERDNHLCQACLKRPATQVHHKTYEHVFDEPLFDLVSICDVCHEAIHNKEKKVEHAK